MSLKENDKSLSSGSFFLVYFYHVTYSSPAPIRKTPFQGFSTASLFPFAYESWRSLHVSLCQCFNHYASIRLEALGQDMRKLFKRFQILLQSLLMAERSAG